MGMLQEVHRVLMKGLPGEQGSGRWSTRPRCAEFEGVLHWYAPAENLEGCVQRMVDEDNRRWKKNGEEGKLETLEFFELMGWWVVRFLKTHPFNDGNRRMVRLIFAYALEAYGFSLPVWIKVWPDDQEDSVLGLESEGEGSEGGRRWMWMLARCQRNEGDEWLAVMALITSAGVAFEVREIYRLMAYLRVEAEAEEEKKKKNDVGCDK